VRKNGARGVDVNMGHRKLVTVFLVLRCVVDIDINCTNRDIVSGLFAVSHIVLYTFLADIVLESSRVCLLPATGVIRG
jgi:hypothetical protein